MRSFLIGVLALTSLVLILVAMGGWRPQGSPPSAEAASRDSVTADHSTDLQSAPMESERVSIAAPDVVGADLAERPVADGPAPEASLLPGSLVGYALSYVGTPLVDRRIIIYPLGPIRELGGRETRTDESGNFEFRNLQPGTWLVCDGFSGRDQVKALYGEVEIQAGQQSSHSFAVRGERSLTLRARVPDLPGLRLFYRVRPRFGATSTLYMKGSMSTFRETCEDGTGDVFSASGLPAELLDLEFYFDSDFRLRQTIEVDLTSGDIDLGCLELDPDKGEVVAAPR